MTTEPTAHSEKEVISGGLSGPFGTVNLLEFAASLEPLAEDIKCFHRHGKVAAALIMCKTVIQRLAHLEHDIDVGLGEN